MYFVPGRGIANCGCECVRGGSWPGFSFWRLRSIVNCPCCFFVLVSFLALKEYFSIIPTRRADRRVLFWAYLAVPVQYLWVWQGWYGMFIIFIPVYMFLFMPLRMITLGETQGFLKAAGTLHWGLMTTVFSLSHAAYLMALPTATNTPAGGGGLLLFLMFLTQFNDVMQFVWGKLFGRFETDLGDCYERASLAFNWDAAHIKAIALAGVDASWLDPTAKAVLRTDFEREIDALSASL